MKKIMHRKLALYTVIFLLLFPLTGLVTASTAPQEGRSGVPTVMSYQGQVMVGGSPYNGTGYFKFAIVDSTGTTSYWSNNGSSSEGSEPTVWVALSVNIGLFNVMLGDTTLSGMTQPLSADVFSGTDRWLRVWFSSDGTSYQQLTPDQRIAAVPYSLQAQFAADTEMLDGLDGSSYQLRIGNSCDIGKTIRSINADGSIECDAHDSQPGFSLSTLDLAGWVSSITIGADGLPIISYRRGQHPYNLGIAHCKDLSCKTFDTLTYEDTVEVGDTAITIGADDLPVISYFDTANEDLKVLHCGNLNCSEENTITTVDSGNRVGRYNAITIGIDGLPIISYYDTDAKHLKIAHCGNISCSSDNLIRTLDNENAVGYYTSIVIGSDGLPIISYRKWGYPSALKIAHCLDTTCSTANITTLDSTVGTGIGTSITIGIDGLPIISHYNSGDSENWILRVAHCGNVDCSGGNTTYDIDTIGTLQKPNSSLAIGSDGLPIISYFDRISEDLRVAHCADIVCSTASIATVDSLGNVGQLSSITIGTDGMPLICYYDQTNSDVKVAHCSNVFCIPYWRRR
jgi:predicted regulator of Ras-like GTPase activity (Roadblock/LC7/MglB family)